MLDIIQEVKQMNSFGGCYPDVIASSADSAACDVLTQNTPLLIVLNSGQEDYTDQKKILEKYGTYMHFEPTIGIAGGPGIFHLPGNAARHINMVQHEKQRITVEDMNGYVVAARGNLGDTISMYRKIIL